MLLQSVLMLMLLAIWSADGSGLLHSGCDLNHVPTMADFDPRRYEGMWYQTHDFHISEYLFDVSSLKYEMTYDDDTDTVASKVFMVFDDGSCHEEVPQYNVQNGVLSRSVVRSSGSVREDVMTVLQTDYDSILLFLYEVFEDGERNDEQSNLSLLVRDPSQPPNMAAVADTLAAFCGPDAASLDFFDSLDFDWSATCDAE